MQRSRIYHFSALAIFLLFVFAGIASGQGNKARIVVGKIENKASGCSNAKASAIGYLLEDALESSNKFVVFDDQAGADVVVTGTVRDFNPRVKSGGVMGALKKKALGAAGAGAKSAKIKWDITLNDLHTGKKIKKMKIEGKSTDWSVDASDSYLSSDIGMAGELVAYSGGPMEDAIKNLLAKSAKEISKNVPKEYFAFTGDEEQSVSTQGSAVAAAAGESSATEGESAAEDMTLYTKYDFVPGDKVIFYDDMANEEEGEFPYRWNLERGVFEVVRLGKEFWIMATDDGLILPKIPKGTLPQQYTVELEFYDNGPKTSGNYFYIQWMDGQGSSVGEFGIVGSQSTWLSIKGKTLADKSLPEDVGKGAHKMRIMATKRSMKCYIDEVRVANVPKIENFDPAGFRLKLRPYNDPENPTLFRGFRFAEGGKSLREQLDETGKIVTHGILFDSGSHKIKGESYKT
ncbi:MAG: hypothetical protein KAT85_10775, partial [candidate division Zixibacteria bacterium]|nr:hypothetical protein [candidate division Zixibacteria bacterium]